MKIKYATLESELAPSEEGATIAQIFIDNGYTPREAKWAEDSNLDPRDRSNEHYHTILRLMANRYNRFKKVLRSAHNYTRKEAAEILEKIRRGEATRIGKDPNSVFNGETP